MRLVALAAAILAVAAAAVAAPDRPGVDRWAVKTMAPTPGVAVTAPIDTLIGLGDVGDVAHNDARYQSVRLNIEGAAMTTTGWLRLVAGEDDGDFHMQLTPGPTANGPCLIVEVPNPTFISDPTLKAQVSAVRAWVLAHALKGRKPAAAGVMLKAPVRVTVTGALFYDDSHVGDPPRGKKGMHAGTLWELHPVTSISASPG